MSLAVLGTGTEVGKTVVSALLAERYAELRPAYWKPVASGAREGRDTGTVRRLTDPAVEVLDETYLFDEPASPHLAARLEGRAIDTARLLDAYRRHAARRRPLVVEGIGGLLVPLDDLGTLAADFFVELGMPAVVVALSTLGTINHTLLTLEAMRSRGLRPAGVVLNGPPEPENRRAVERFGEIEVVGELPPLDPLDRPALARAALSFDVSERLRPYLEPPAAA